jgi:hypothetical protein
MFSFGDIEDAFLFVSSSSYGMNSAILCRTTGRIFYRSEMGGIDEVGDEELDGETCVAIPHRNDLDLGQRLVFEFIQAHLPGEYNRVEEIFRKRGAYGPFKNFLESKGMLKAWYEFEKERENQALRQWCDENGIDLSG